MPHRLLFLVTLALAGCASATDAYTDGMDYEVAGDYVSAADAYITALERDPTIRNVPGRLRVAGREAIRLELSSVSPSDVPGTAEAYLRADALVQRAGAVGVALDRPAAFETDRDAALAAAVDHYLESARAQQEAGLYETALTDVAEARRFRPSAARLARLNALTADVYGQWAEEDFAAGRYHAALGRVDAALATPGAQPDALADLRAQILDAGLVVAAVLPAEGDDEVADAFLRDLTDVLVEDHLEAPGPFVLLVDPADVRRWDRRQRRRRSGPALTDSPRRIAEASDDLGADYGVALLVRAIDEEERVGEAEPVRARLRQGGGAASYSRRDVDLTLSTSADVVIVDARTGRTVCDETVRQRAEGRYRRATTEGDWRDLDLSRAERALFSEDPGAATAAETSALLRDRLAGALAEPIAACLDRQVE